MKVIILARVSTEEQDSNAQLVRLKKYCENRPGFDQIELFDFDESAYKENRVKFQEVLEIIKKSSQKVILVCDKIDRLTRNFNKELVQVEKFRQEGKLEMHFPSDNMIIHKDSPANDLMRFGFGIIAAKYFSDSISDNVKRRFEEKISKGEVLTKAVYGYRNERVDERHGTIVLEPFESKIVRQIFEWYDTKSYSINEIRNKLANEQNLNFHRSKIERILKEKFYYGIATYRKGNLEYPHAYDTIISKEMFERCQDTRNDRSKINGKVKLLGKPALYRGLIKCAVCGRSISPEYHRQKFYYSCTDFDKVCKKKYISEDKITDQFSEIFKSIEVPQTGLDYVVENLRKANNDKQFMNENIINNLNSEYKILSDRKSKMYDDYLDHSITKDFYEEKLNEYTKRQEEITGKLNKLTNADENFYITMGYIFQLAKHAHDLFLGSEMEERRQIINLVFLNVKMNGEKLEPVMDEAFELLRNLDNYSMMGDLLGTFRTKFTSFNISIEQFKIFFQNFGIQPLVL